MTADHFDISRYAAVECQKITPAEADEQPERRYVRLHDEPMDANDVLPWLEEQGLVSRIAETCADPECDHEHCDGYRLVGWGTTYFAVPWDRSVER